MTKTDLHRLVDELPESAVSLAVRVLQAIRDEADPLLSTLENAPYDDEPLTPEDLEAIQEGREAWARGETVSHEQLKRDLEL